MTRRRSKRRSSCRAWEWASRSLAETTSPPTRAAPPLALIRAVCLFCSTAGFSSCVFQSEATCCFPEATCLKSATKRKLEKATVDFMFARLRERNELFTAYVAHLELLARELEKQLHPAPPLDERIKAIILLRNCQLEKEQRIQLALKRAGTQTFQEVADQLRTLHRPEAFLHSKQQPQQVQPKRLSQW